jgi:transcriptional regulator with XRE-family HTH domain
VAGRRQGFGERLRDRRLELGLSQTALANKLPGSTDLNYVSRWERGVHAPNASMLPHLAAALDVDTADLEEALLFDRPGADAPLSQLDRLERKVELLLDAMQVDWRGEFATAAEPALEVFEGQAETAPQDAAPPADRRRRGPSRPARGQS